MQIPGERVAGAKNFTFLQRLISFRSSHCETDMTWTLKKKRIQQTMTTSNEEQHHRTWFPRGCTSYPYPDDGHKERDVQWLLKFTSYCFFGCCSWVQGSMIQEDLNVHTWNYRTGITEGGWVMNNEGMKKESYFWSIDWLKRRRRYCKKKEGENEYCVGVWVQSIYTLPMNQHHSITDMAQRGGKGERSTHLLTNKKKKKSSLLLWTLTTISLFSIFLRSCLLSSLLPSFLHAVTQHHAHDRHEGDVRVLQGILLLDPFRFPCHCNHSPTLLSCMLHWSLGMKGSRLALLPAYVRVDTTVCGDGFSHTIVQ